MLSEELAKAQQEVLSKTLLTANTSAGEDLLPIVMSRDGNALEKICYGLWSEEGPLQFGHHLGGCTMLEVLKFCRLSNGNYEHLP
jgi:hypothetical protein